MTGPAEGIRQVADDLERFADQRLLVASDIADALRVDAAALRELAAEVDGGDQ